MSRLGKREANININKLLRNVENTKTLYVVFLYGNENRNQPAVC